MRTLCRALLWGAVAAASGGAQRARAQAAPHHGAATDTAKRRHTEADVRFMQQMIGHHEQALVMAALVPSRTRREDVRRMSQRIEVSQRDEIRLMTQWLEDRHEPVPDHRTHDAGAHDVQMPGMLTARQVSRLRASSGKAFDRLFLRGMIDHHQGALTMVARLLATGRAAQEPELFSFLSDVDSGQRAEILRMRTMLGARTPTPSTQRK